MNETVLEVKNLTVDFKVEENTYRAIEGIDFSLKKQSTLAIVGESGSGKSVTSLALMQLLPDNGRVVEGEVSIEGRDMLGIGVDRFREEVLGQELSMIFQEPMTALNPVLRIGDQLTEGILLHQKINKQEAKSKAIDILNEVGISSPEKRLKQYPHELSGGMRQRVMIAMALLCKPKVIIADEPTTALDVTIEAQILDLIDNLKTEFDTSILFITHDLNVVADIADDVIVMYCGQVIEKGSVTDIFHAPKHPYTKGLLGAMPRLDIDVEELQTIEGNVPSIGNRPSGCYFRSRCKEVGDMCISTSPLLTKVDNQEVRCHLFNK